MAETQDDYWPADIAKSDIITPASLMRTQAALLGEKTNQQITATVQALAQSPSDFVWSFQLISTTLGSYRYELFRVIHPIPIYPATVFWEGHPNKVVQDQDQFKDALKEILGSDQTKKILHSLLAQIVR
jgi:hypothetical protein